MPDEGLIIDVRGNGGGAITAAERLLQLFTPREVSPSRAQFTTSPLLLDIARRHAPSQLPNFDLSPWIDSLREAVATGSEYSRGYPITDPAEANDRGQRYYGPVVLLVDALSYSATDIFAAGFIDHEIGPVIGASDNMGAGGANVWRHSDLAFLAGDAETGLAPLARGAEMRVAVRRITRVGASEGEVLEDLGIRIDQRHHMRAEDLTDHNAALIRRAAGVLRGRAVVRFDARLSRLARGRLSATVTSDGVESVEVRINGRAAGRLEPNGGREVLAGLPARRVPVELVGYGESAVVARHRQLV